MNVLFVAAECAPFAKTGGLGDVVGALPKALAARGVDVRVVLPLYRGLPWHTFELLPGVVVVPMGPAAGGTQYARLRRGRLPQSSVEVWFLEHHGYFDRPGLYGHHDDLARFAFLSRGALEACKSQGWLPDVVHAHDWHAALAPVYVNTVEWLKPLHAAATVLTIHNLAFQGVATRAALAVTGLGDEHYNPAELEHFGTLNLMKGGIRHATLVTTVSPTYAAEICTSAQGFGLDGELRRRGAELRGILNGIDEVEWDPARDPRLPARFDAGDLGGKAICKAELQRRGKLRVDAGVPMFGMVARLTRQKGADVVAAALKDLLKLDLQVAILGAGDADIENALGGVAVASGGRAAFWRGYDEDLSHLIEAGSDFFLMPSRFEPCGLNQMYSQRYGTPPIVRRTGGLADTVEPYDEETGAGTGFVLEHLDMKSLWDTVAWAVSTWFDRPAHVAALRAQGMAKDFSWGHAAGEYVRLYQDAVRMRRGG